MRSASSILLAALACAGAACTVPPADQAGQSRHPIKVTVLPAVTVTASPVQTSARTPRAKVSECKTISTPDDPAHEVQAKVDCMLSRMGGR